MPNVKKPLIAINGDFRPKRKDGGALSWFNTGYYDSITAAGGLPIMIPPFADDADLQQLLETVDGLVLAGCSQDLDPTRMGMQMHPQTRPMPPRREEFDRRLSRLAVEMRLPIVAIGAGMQTLNVVCGGTLFQHVVEEVPKALHHFDPVEEHNRHLIEIVEGTRCWDIYGPGEIRVNSRHRMSVNQLATPFRVSAMSPDGVIECFESIEDEWFCLGVQWHPEDDTASALDMQIFQEFIAAAKGLSSPTILPMSQRIAA